MHIHHFQIYDRIRAIALVIFLGCFLIVMPVQAQTSKESPITLDGRQLFTVSDTGQVSAENRSTDANLILKEAVNSREPVKVEIIENNQLPVIRVQGRHLLTITSQDVPAGRTKEEQAQIWARMIAESIEQGQQERRVSYISCSTSNMHIMELIEILHLRLCLLKDISLCCNEKTYCLS